MAWSDLITSLEQFLAYRPDHALFLLVHAQANHLTAAAQQLQHQYPAWRHLALSTTLALGLRDIAPARRPRQTPRLCATAIHSHTPGPLLCTDIDLLFEPSLRLDPLRLLLDASRQTTLIVTWPGTDQDHRLAYAAPEHAHYRTWPRSDLCDYCVIQLSDHYW